MLPRGGNVWAESWRICKRQVKWLMLILSVGSLTVVSSKALMLFPLGGGTNSQRGWVTCRRSTVGTWTWKSLSRVLCKLGEMRLQKAVFGICMWAWTRVWEGLNYAWFDLCVEMKLLCFCTRPPKFYIAVTGTHLKGLAHGTSLVVQWFHCRGHGFDPWLGTEILAKKKKKRSGLLARKRGSGSRNDLGWLRERNKGLKNYFVFWWINVFNL